MNFIYPESDSPLTLGAEFELKGELGIPLYEMSLATYNEHKTVINSE